MIGVIPPLSHVPSWPLQQHHLLYCQIMYLLHIHSSWLSSFLLLCNPNTLNSIAKYLIEESTLHNIDLLDSCGICLQMLWNAWCERVRLLNTEDQDSSYSETSVATSTSSSTICLASSTVTVPGCGYPQNWCDYEAKIDINTVSWISGWDKTCPEGLYQEVWRNVVKICHEPIFIVEYSAYNTFLNDKMYQTFHETLQRVLGLFPGDKMIGPCRGQVRVELYLFLPSVPAWHVVGLPLLQLPKNLILLQVWNGTGAGYIQTAKWCHKMTYLEK
jgi:hypothetical protein